jgi:ABC-type amino acid transport substrate-binding protein
MSTTALRRLPATYEPTVEALHRLAVYVISPAQRLANGEIIMRPSPQGFSTFEFAAGRVVGVRADRLTIDDAEHPITSLREAARLVGIEPDVSQQEQFDVPPHGDLDEMLAVDAEAATALGDWYAFAEQALDALRADASAGDDATIVRIWPEHFDAAIDMGDGERNRRATYGASPGDRHHPEPYLYASPWAGRIDGFFSDPSFKGAALRRAQLEGSADPLRTAVQFLREARIRVQLHG